MKNHNQIRALDFPDYVPLGQPDGTDLSFHI
jgi:hypothetical protein